MAAKRGKKPSNNLSKIAAGAVLVVGLILGVLVTFFTFAEWTLARKLIVAVVLSMTLLVLEILDRRQKKPRGVRKKLPQLLDLFIKVQKELDPESKSFYQTVIVFQVLKLALVTSILTIALAALFRPLEKTFEQFINPPTATHTPTPIPTLTQTLTRTLAPTMTWTPSPEPMSDFLQYMVILDASVNMNESFDGGTKWAAALDSLNIILRRLNPLGRYSLVTIGGSSTSGVNDPCIEPSISNPSFGIKNEFQHQINQLAPAGGGSFSTAFNTASIELESLPLSAIRTLILITGTDDTCEGGDEWAELARVLSLPNASELYSEIIVLDEQGIRFRTIQQHLSTLIDVNVQYTRTNQELEQASEIASGNLIAYIQQETEDRATDTPRPENIPINPTNTYTPSLTATTRPPPPTTITPSNTAFTPATDTPSLTPSPIPTTEIPPTFPETIPAHQLTYLSSQADVFSPNCFLLDHDRVYDHFANNQAFITTTLADGRTGQGLRLDYFNVHEADWNYAGWEVWFGVNDQSGIDLSAKTKLVFFIKGGVGGEQPNVYLMMPITTDYWRFWKDVELVTPVTTSWRRVEIPLSHFASSQEPHQQVELRNVQRIQILFEWYPQITSGTIFVDDLCVQ